MTNRGSDHYITVLSNYDKDIFPQNKNNDFQNRMANGIPCGDGSKIALIELSFEHNFRMKPRKNCSFEIFDFLHHSEQGWGQYTEIHLSEELINNSLDLVLLLNDYIYQIVPRLKEKKREIFFLGKNKHIWMNFQPDDYIMILLKEAILPLVGAIDRVIPRAAIAIGLSKEKNGYTYNGDKRQFAPQCSKAAYKSQCTSTDYFIHRPEIDLIKDFLVLSNAVAPSNVASSLTQLLAVVNVPENTAGHRTVASFAAAPFYIPVNVSTLSNVRIRLDSFDGKPIEVVGQVRALLHVITPPQ